MLFHCSSRAGRETLIKKNQPFIYDAVSKAHDNLEHGRHILFGHKKGAAPSRTAPLSRLQISTLK